MGRSALGSGGRDVRLKLLLGLYLPRPPNGANQGAPWWRKHPRAAAEAMLGGWEALVVVENFTTRDRNVLRREAGGEGDGCRGGRRGDAALVRADEHALPCHAAGEPPLPVTLRIAAGHRCRGWYRAVQPEAQAGASAVGGAIADLARHGLLRWDPQALPRPAQRRPRHPLRQTLRWRHLAQARGNQHGRSGSTDRCVFKSTGCSGVAVRLTASSSAIALGERELVALMFEATDVPSISKSESET